MFFHIKSNDKRLSYRVCPHEKLPVHIVISGHTVQPVDIGAGGIAFHNVNFNRGDRTNAVLQLPGYGRSITADIIILSVDGNNVCHCNFSRIESGDIDRIHKYVLEVQKEEIKSRREEEGGR